MKTRSVSRNLTLVLLLITLPLSGCSTGREAAAPVKATPTPLPTLAALAKTTYIVQRGDVVGTVGFTGRIAPVNQQPLFFPVDGRIHTVYVIEGDTIKSDTLIADLEGAPDLQRQVELNQLGVKRSQLNADIAQMNFDLFLQQTSKGTPGYEKLLAIEQDKLDLAKLDVQQASLGLQELQEALAKNQLLAPMDGQVTSLQISEGTQVRGFEPVGTVADITQLEVSAVVSDTTILDKLDVGMSATLVPASGTGKLISGSVRRLPVLGNAQTTDQDNSIRVSLDISPADAGYQMGDLVDVAVTVIKRTDVLWIPPQAVRNFGGRKFVVVQEGDLQSRVDVKIGVIGADRAEVLVGLREGQVVVGP